MPNSPDSRPGNPKTMSDADELVPGVGRGIDAIGADPEHAHVDQPRQAQLRVLEATELDRARCQRRDRRRVEQLVERLQPLRLRRRVLGVGREHVDALAGREHRRDLPVEGRVVGVDDDLDLARYERVVEVVVHRAADEGDAQRHEPGSTTPTAPRPAIGSGARSTARTVAYASSSASGTVMVISPSGSKRELLEHAGTRREREATRRCRAP